MLGAAGRKLKIKLALAIRLGNLADSVTYTRVNPFPSDRLKPAPGNISQVIKAKEAGRK